MPQCAAQFPRGTRFSLLLRIQVAVLSLTIPCFTAVGNFPASD